MLAVQDAPVDDAGRKPARCGLVSGTALAVEPSGAALHTAVGTPGVGNGGLAAFVPSQDVAARASSSAVAAGDGRVPGEERVAEQVAAGSAASGNELAAELAEARSRRDGGRLEFLPYQHWL